MATFPDPEDFAAKAKEASGETEKLIVELNEARSALSGLQAQAREELMARSPIARAKQDLRELERQYKDVAAAREGAFRARSIDSGLVAKAQREADDAKAAAKKEHDDWRMESEEKAGDMLLQGSLAAAKAAAGLVVAAGAFVVAGAKMAIESTAAKDKQVAILDRLTGGQGAIAEEVSQGLAERSGVDEDKTLERVKGLIQAKFNRADTEQLALAAADIGEIKGQGAADAFLSSLEKMSARGKATERDLRAMAGAGIELKSVFEALKKPGETIEEVEARLKAGKIASLDFARAAATAAKTDFGGIAGQGLDAQIAKLKIRFGDMFEDFDLSPVKAALSEVESILESPTGNALKEGVRDVLQSTIDLLKVAGTTSGKQGLKDFFESATTVATTLAGAIREIKAELKTLADWHAEGGIFTLKNLGRVLTGSNSVGDGEDTDADRAARIAENRKHLAEVEAEHARTTGKALSDGLAKGIDENAPKVSAAMERAVGGGIDAGNRKAGVQSPSTVAAESGRYYDEGWALGIDRHAGLPEQAAERLAARVTRGGAAKAPARGEGATDVAAGATQRIFQLNYSPSVTLLAGSAPEAQAGVTQALALDYQEVLKLIRQAERDSQEIA